MIRQGPANPEDDRKELLSLLRRRSFMARPERPFQLASGKTSPYYLDGKNTTLDPRGALLVGRLIFARLRGRGIQAVGGLTLGADPIAVAVAVASELAGEPIRAFVVRKQPKGHGTDNWIEGGLEPASHVAVVEDVVTSGGSICLAIERIQAAGHRIGAAVAIVDREDGGADKVQAAANVPLEALFSLQELIADSSPSR